MGQGGHVNHEARGSVWREGQRGGPRKTNVTTYIQVHICIHIHIHIHNCVISTPLYTCICMKRALHIFEEVPLFSNTPAT